MAQYLVPSKTNGLLLTLKPKQASALLVIGSNRLAASRIFTALEANFVVYVTFPKDDKVDPEVTHRISSGEVQYIELAEERLIDVISELPDLDVVCVTDSLVAPSNTRRRSYDSCASIAHFCATRRIHINIVDITSLNDISFPATHRWRSEDGRVAHSLQIAVNTFGKGCRLATRIKREIVSSLPPEIGRAVDNVATLRSRIIALSTAEDVGERSENDTQAKNKVLLDEEDDQVIGEPINTPVAQYGSGLSGYFTDAENKPIENSQESRARRMKWVAQVSEYWPIRKLGRLRDNDIERILADFDGNAVPRIPSASSTPMISRTTSTTHLSALGNTALGSPRAISSPIAFATSPPSADFSLTTTNHQQEFKPSTPSTLHSLNLSRPEAQDDGEPRVLLLGSGPGHPALLTLAAFNALKTADLVLADKLVPSPVLQLIPSSVETIIAKKFPGNAENAQVELQQLALNFVMQRKAEGRGGTVVRLKQGDPYIYGRGGEEVLFFRSHGIETIIVPGISSAIAAPLLCNIPVTQRGVSDSLILCTGVGRAGKTSVMPGFVRSRTLIVLMGVARIGELITALTSDDEVVGTRREAQKYPGHLPIALIERGSSKDQRMLLSTLKSIESAIERVGDQRPPGMLVIGWCCLALEGSGNVDVTEKSGLEAGEEGDHARVRSVLGERGYLVREGVRSDWMHFLDEMARVQ